MKSEAERLDYALRSWRLLLDRKLSLHSGLDMAYLRIAERHLWDVVCVAELTDDPYGDLVWTRLCGIVDQLSKHAEEKRSPLLRIADLLGA